MKIDNMAIAKLSNKQLVIMYNSLAEETVKKFRSLDDGRQRLVQQIMASKPSVKKQKELFGIVLAQETQPQPQPQVTKFIGRPSRYKGKKIYGIGRKVEDWNPRRQGSHGNYSWSVMYDGMLFEDYRRAGGRTKDLAWNVMKGYLEVR